MNSACTACAHTFNPTTSTTYVGTVEMDNVNLLDGSEIVGFKVSDALSLDAAGTYAINSFDFLLGFT